MKILFTSRPLIILTLFIALSYSSVVTAQSNRILGEVTLFAGTFSPRGWHACDGALLSIDKNQALFSILTTSYGGDGRTNFGMPNMTAPLPTMRYIISMDGLYPSRSGGTSSDYNAFYGEVILFSGDFVPDGWKECNGQAMKINENSALYSLIGTMYGGDGNTIFNLPKLTAPANTRYIICTLGIFPSRQ